MRLSLESRDVCDGHRILARETRGKQGTSAPLSLGHVSQEPRDGVPVTSHSCLFSSISVHLCTHEQMAFREAHEVSGKVVSRAEELGCDVTQIPLHDLQQIR